MGIENKTTPPEVEQEINEEEVLERAKTGDKQAMMVLYNKYNPILKNFILSRTKSVAETEDILQTTWEKVIKSIKKTKISNFKNWVITIASRTFIDRYHKEKRRGNYEDFDENTTVDPDTVPSSDGTRPIDEAIDEREIRKKIDEAISEFDEDTQKIIKSRIDGAPFEEISKNTNRKKQAVKSIFHRAKAKLKKKFSKKDRNKK